MNLRSNWKQVKLAFEAGIKSSLHCAIATVDADGNPHVTPIGFIFLRDDLSAFYFEEYTQKMRQNIQGNPRVCLLTINSGGLFWLASLYREKFASSPGIRLFGVAGERRLATEHEKEAYRDRVKSARRLKGYDLIWRDLNHVRDIKLDSFEPVVYPKMTEHLWT